MRTSKQKWFWMKTTDKNQTQKRSALSPEPNCIFCPSWKLKKKFFYFIVVLIVLLWCKDDDDTMSSYKIALCDNSVGVKITLILKTTSDDRLWYIYIHTYLGSLLMFSTRWRSMTEKISSTELRSNLSWARVGLYNPSGK